MYSDGHEVDGSWVLRVYVTDLQVERNLRVKGELHIGGVMLRLVEDLGKSSVQDNFFYILLNLISNKFILIYSHIFIMCFQMNEYIFFLFKIKF